MQYSIEEMLKREDQITANMTDKFGDYISLFNEHFNYNFDLFTEVDPTKLYYFFNFYSQYNKSLILAFMSVIRLHDFQHKYNMRYALESASICFYSLYNNDTLNDDKKYYNISKDGVLIRNKMLPNKAYSLIELKDRETSNKMKEFKKTYNKYIHSNIMNTQNNFQMNNKEYKMNVFDKHSNSERENACIEMSLWSICNVNYGMINLMLKGIKENRFEGLLTNEFEKEFILIGQKTNEMEKRVKEKFDKNKIKK